MVTANTATNNVEAVRMNVNPKMTSEQLDQYFRDGKVSALVAADQAAGVPAATTVSTWKRAGMLSASVLGAGIVTLPLSAQAAQTSRAVAEKNPTLKKQPLLLLMKSL